jgi:WD40 repeat protein
MRDDDDDEALRALARRRAMARAAMRASDGGAMAALVRRRHALADDADRARAAFPTAFGRGGGAGATARDVVDDGARATAALGARDDDDDGGGGGGGGGGGEADQGSGEEEYEEEDAIPRAAEAVMEGFKKPATCCAVDRSGARMAAGSSDGVVRLYDFNGMKRDLQPFRSIAPREGYPIHAVDWSPTGDMFVAASGSWQPTVHDRDGVELGEFDKGDMYIRDLRNTKGHVAATTDVKWNPLDKETICTAGEDGALRLWDVTYLGDARGSQKAVLKPQQVKPGRVQVTSCAYSHDGDLIAGGITDGSVQIFSSKGSQYKSATIGLVLPPSQQCKLDNHWTFNGRPSHLFKGAHPAGEEVTSLSFGRDGRTLLSRCEDGTLNVWDLRNVKAPLKRFEDLPTRHSETTVGWSPNDVYFFTGVDAERDSRGGNTQGGLCFFDREKLEMVHRVSTPTNCIAATWHPRLNQIFVGCGDAKGGELRVLYDPKKSMGGITQAVGKAVRKKADDFVRIDVQEISYTPNALPAFKEQMPGKRKLDSTDIARQALRKNPSKAVTNMDKSGVLTGGTGASLLTQHIMHNNEELGEKNWMKTDARESILRHAEKAAANPMFTKKAYEHTQPKEIWREEEKEGDSD